MENLVNSFETMRTIDALELYPKTFDLRVVFAAACNSEKGYLIALATLQLTVTNEGFRKAAKLLYSKEIIRQSKRYGKTN